MNYFAAEDAVEEAESLCWTTFVTPWWLGPRVLPPRCAPGEDKDVSSHRATSSSPTCTLHKSPLEAEIKFHPKSLSEGRATPGKAVHGGHFIAIRD